MNVEITNKIDFNEYGDFVDKNSESTFYSSKKHITYLEKNLGIKSSFITSYKKGKITGVLPFFSKKEKYGIVVNSLPFFGSYGGTVSENLESDKKILEELNRFNKENDVLSTVITDNPFKQKKQVYKKYYNFHIDEDRLIQSTILKNKTSNEIWKNLEKRSRWSVRKSEKNNIKIITENIDKKHMKKFYQLHVDSMKVKGGRPKPKNIFSIILENFESHKDYDILVAMKETKPIAYILVFYYKNFAEYYLPAYDPEFISLQATSNLIWESMKIAQLKKIEYYNFGGTWKNQKELYLFKRGWNATDFNYKYFIYRDLDKIKEAGLEEIINKYEYFYVCPFDEIKN